MFHVTLRAYLYVHKYWYVLYLLIYTYNNIHIIHCRQTNGEDMGPSAFWIRTDA
jgi:hypothetical protein